MIFNLRGCGGSGKSYVGFKLLQEYGPGTEVRRPAFRTKSDKLLAHVLPGDLALVGRYVLKNSTRIEGAGYSGGVDGWNPMTEVQELIEGFANEHNHIFFEGLLISGTTQRWIDFAKKYPYQVTFGVLTTPPEVCIQRILARNGGRPIDEHNVRVFHATVQRSGDKLEAAGQRVLRFDTANAYEVVRNEFVQAGWDPTRGY